MDTPTKIKLADLAAAFHDLHYAFRHQRVNLRKETTLVLVTLLSEAIKVEKGRLDRACPDCGNEWLWQNMGSCWSETGDKLGYL
jgi:hypothetical protein